MNKKTIGLIILVLAAGAAVSTVAARATSQQELWPPDISIGAVRPTVKPALAKIDPLLAALFRPELISEAEAAGLVVNVARRDFLQGDGKIQIVAETRSDFAAAGLGPHPAAAVVRAQIEALGGTYETSYQNLVQARMSPEGIQALAGSELVNSVRLPLRPFTTAVSEGVATTGAGEWQSLAAYRANGVKPKVAVLDLGFTGYASLLGTDLPSTVTTRSFRSDGNLTPSQPHGAACAEIIYDMCPDVDLYLVNFGTDVEQHNAVSWLIGQGVQVISYSIGWTNAGDGKGTGPICADPERAAAAGIAWCSSSGNDANSHWEGTFSDTNSNSAHNFTSTNEYMSFYVPAYNVVSIWLNWDDWGTWNSGTGTYSGSNQDYDLQLYYWTGSSWQYVASSLGYQTGTQWPVEGVGYYYLPSSTYWGVVISKYSATRACKLEVFTSGNNDYTPIQYAVPSGSLTIPADAPGAIAAGATDAITDAYHIYSSCGPTHDGRVKPDFAAPSGVSGITYGYRNFYGTSAAAPHLAGAFGLLKGKTRYSTSEIRQILEGRAVELGAAGKDNVYGIGRLDLRK